MNCPCSSQVPELKKLREENARLKALLTNHGIQWEDDQPSAAIRPPETVPSPHSQLSPDEKIAIFRNLFKGRADVFPLRWESSKGKSGYSPACRNEWKTGVCRKPKVKCADCDQRQLLPITDSVIYDHLAGKHTVGVYPLLADDTCWFLAVDFDGADWPEDAIAFMQSCREIEIPAALEISRSGNGAHVWIFFSEPIPARDARKLGAALISRTCARTRQLSLSSYDRFFPNQDILPRGGFGNLIALPLQKRPRSLGRSVFVDEKFSPYPDQWRFLFSIQPLLKTRLDDAILNVQGDRNALDVGFSDEPDNRRPWERPAPAPEHLSGPLSAKLALVLANQIFIAKEDLPRPLSNRLIRLAAFQNPEFYKAQAMRLSVWNKPRIIGCAENFPMHIGLPRGCLEPVQELLKKNGIQDEIQDERKKGRKIAAKFTGKLRKDQKAALRAISQHDFGVLSAPTAFGKTIVAAALIARRKVSTLVLVHRTELLRQWQARLTSFIDLPKDGMGAYGGGKKKISGGIDIAVMQSLSRREDLAEFLEDYGQIIVDECHHISAFSFESVLRQAKARFVVGLTATPIRRDGHHPIIFMQCGPVRHAADRSEIAPARMEVIPRCFSAPEIPDDATIQSVFRILVNDETRNGRIADDIDSVYREGRKVLALTERTDHLYLLKENLSDKIENLFVLHGRLSRKQRTSILADLNDLEDSAPRVLLATGRLIGEGFDHAPLDTLALAMPISWKGTLQQYAGRLHRTHDDKRDVRIYDYVENDHPQLARMWEKRQRGYRAMGYEIRDE